MLVLINIDGHEADVISISHKMASFCSECPSTEVCMVSSLTNIPQIPLHTCEPFVSWRRGRIPTGRSHSCFPSSAMMAGNISHFHYHVICFQCCVSSHDTLELIPVPSWKSQWRRAIDGSHPVLIFEHILLHSVRIVLCRKCSPTLALPH